MGELFRHRLDNGIVLLAERLPERQSGACALLIPAGAATDPPQRSGLASLVQSYLFRGTAERDARWLAAELDHWGLLREQQVEREFASFSIGFLPRHLSKALKLCREILTEPRFPPEALEEVRQQALHALVALEDSPQQLVIQALLRRFYPAPWGNPPLGEQADLQSISHAEVLHDHARRYTPRGTLLAIVGPFDWSELKDKVEECFDRPQIEVLFHAFQRFFSPHPLGQLVLGTTETVQNLTRDAMHAYLEERYTPSNLILATVGAFDWKRFVQRAEVLCEAWEPRKTKRRYPPIKRHKVSEAHEGRRTPEIIGKPQAALEQIALVSPAPAYTGIAKRRDAASLLAALIGGKRNSRLFWALVEPGLAERAVMHYRPFDRTGLFVTQIVFQGEQSISRLFSFSFDRLYDQPYRSLAEEQKRIEDVRPSDLNELLRHYPLEDHLTVLLGPRERL